MELRREREYHRADRTAHGRSVSRLRSLFPQSVVARVLVALVPLYAVWGCTRSAEDSNVLRFIDAEPTEKFSGLGHMDVVPVFTWTFHDPSDLESWRGIHLDLQSALVRDAVQVNFPASSDPGERPGLVRAVDLESEALAIVSVQLRGSAAECRGGGSVQLYWSGPDKGFSEERSIVGQAIPDGGYGTATVVFRLNQNPLWRGHVSALRIDPALTPGCTLRVQLVGGSKYEVAEGRLDAAAGQARKVTIDNETRSALLAPPGHAIERELDVPQDAVFSFSYGVANGMKAPVQFDVFLEDGGTNKRLYRADLDPDSLFADRGWQEAEVDLSAFAGRRVKLRLETSTSAPFDPNVSSPAWGNPVVWRRGVDVASPNVILVSLDTLRADHLSLYGYERNTSPNVDRWASESGVTFENVVAPSPWTLPSHASLFTGLNAFHHGVNHDSPVPPSLPLMAEIFREAGYSTMAVTGGGWVSPTMGFARGFERFRTWGMAYAGEREMATGIDDAIEWMRTQDRQPFFLFFHTFEIHSPFRAREPFFTDLGGSGDEATGSYDVVQAVETAPTAGLEARHSLVRVGKSGERSETTSKTDYEQAKEFYDSGIAYADNQLARLFRALDDLDLRRRTIVVVTADHGEALGEKDLVGHTHLYDFNLMVPLVVALPDGRDAGRRIAEQVSLVDVLPTVLELAGIPTTLDFDGSSLVPLLDGKSEGGRREAWSYAAVTNVGISLRVSNKLKYIYDNTAWRASEEREQLYRLDTDRDEESNVAASASEVTGMRERVREAIDAGGSGLKVHFANALGRAFSGRLRAPFLRPARTKTMGLPCPCFSWRDIGFISFEVPPGQSFDLFLESVGPGELEVEASGGKGSTHFESRVDPGALGGSQIFAFDGSSWTTTHSSAGGSPSTGIALGWHGGGAVGAPAARNELVSRQLQALGYVND